MSREIEADFNADYGNEEKRCPLCDSYEVRGGGGYCRELEQAVPPTGHCDFFRSAD